MAFGDDDDLPNEGVRIKRADDHPKQSIGSPDVVIAKTSLASIESLTMPLMQEVVLSADIRCAECQKRVADVMSRMSGNNKDPFFYPLSYLVLHFILFYFLDETAFFFCPFFELSI